MPTDSMVPEGKHKFSQLVFNATEVNGKVKEWRTIHDAARNLLATPTPHIVENQEVQLAFAMLPLLTGAPELSYPRLQAVVQKFRTNLKSQPEKQIPVGLLDDARKPQAAQAKPRTLLAVESTTEKISTEKNRGIILQDVDMFPGNSPMPVTQLYEDWPGTTPASPSTPQTIHGHTSPGTENVVGGSLHSHRSTSGSPKVSATVPALQGTKIDGARKEISNTLKKRKQILESSSDEEDDRAEAADLDKKKRRHTSKADEAVNNTVQRAAVPCRQCNLDEVECFKFVKRPRGRIRRAYAHCSKKRRHCSFIPRPSDFDNEASWNILQAVANRSENFSWLPSGPPSTRVKQELSLGNVTTRVNKVEDMVMDLQDQFNTIQEKVVVMDTRIEDLFESTKSVARVLKGFETRSEQANKVIEKLVERVERL